ncbi:MAG TPA: hypothetical protein VHR84_01470 [Terriglobales bacterium]|jgi:hypothetical protein|nr:hypothetical protein [Terriglobales bacterium]
MPSNLSAQIVALCQKASCEQDTHKLLELTKEINELLQLEEQTKQSQLAPVDGHSDQKRSA